MMSFEMCSKCSSPLQVGFCGLRQGDLAKLERLVNLKNAQSGKRDRAQGESEFCPSPLSTQNDSVKTNSGCAILFTSISRTPEPMFPPIF